MRVLIFTADIGEGHDLPARMLRDGILERHPGAEVRIVDALEAAGPLAQATVRNGAETILEHLRPLFDLQYWLVSRWRPSRAVAGLLAMALSARGLRRTIAAWRPDVVVSTYPGATEVLGRLHRQGHFAVPLVSAITDLAALRYWAHPGCDLHLVIHPESAAEVYQIAGPETRVAHVRGLTRPEFEHPVEPAAARTALGLDPGAPVVVVSGGGWGIGDLEGAVHAGLAAAPDVVVVALCGRNEPLRRRLTADFSGTPRVTVMGFTDRMAGVLGAADVLVHSTAGLTVMEALVQGARVVSYGWGIAHIRVNNDAYVRFGLAEVATDAPQLTEALRRALASPRRPDAGYRALPAAADLVLDIGGGQ